MTAEPLLLGLLFFAAAAAGWFVARFTARPRGGETQGVPPARFYRGLDHVLRDESDKALEVLQSMAEADPGVVEIHFALATLFRRRGETDRAIRIHRDLLARPGLARAHRDQALYDLAGDYQRAGLYDRAEALYTQLVEQDVYRARALEQLVAIYERQRDFEQAIAARRQLARIVPGKHGAVIAHYYCELAARSQAAGDLATMRQLLRQARRESPDLARGAMMRAQLAILRDDPALARRLYRRVLESDPRMAVEVLAGLRSSCNGERACVDEVLGQALRRDPQLAAALGRAALAVGPVASEIAAAAARDLLLSEPALAPLGTDIDTARAALHALGLARVEYLCSVCGYRASELNWQCRACSQWDTARADIRLRAHRSDA